MIIEYQVLMLSILEYILQLKANIHDAKLLDSKQKRIGYLSWATDFLIFVQGLKYLLIYLKHNHEASGNQLV